MSPLRCMQSTAPHLTVILEEVTSDVATVVGEDDGAGNLMKESQKHPKELRL